MVKIKKKITGKKSGDQVVNFGDQVVNFGDQVTTWSPLGRSTLSLYVSMT